MYSPAYNRNEDRADVLAFMRAHGFVLVVTGTGGELHASHLPCVVEERDGQLRLSMHMARTNPQWQQFFGDEAMVVFAGPHAYVSPRWYEDRPRVPTWNYVAVHAYGPAEFFEDAGRLLDVVTRLTDLHERPRAEPWAVTDAPETFIRAQLKGIVGLRLPITRIEGKRKMSQNRSAADRAGVAAGLAASDRASDRAVAALIPG